MQALFLRAFFTQRMTFLAGEIDIFHIRNVQLRQLSAAGGAVEFVAVEDMDAPAVFAVMNVHHGSSLLPFFFILAHPSFCGKEKRSTKRDGCG
ncbi:MAG TPA: hypothetical protein H9700_02660 [Candidatus Eisenbergiella intestinipullorum]|nr:hypothetical protein [Candidatus Eisenbergiella intestinipullorum]